MALLQISEPGLSIISNQHKFAIGIDLGTTNSLVAIVRNNIPEVLKNKEGHTLLPSVVRYLSNGLIDVGYKAKIEQTKDPKNTITSIKRLMGRSLKDIVYSKNLSYDFQETPGMVQLKTIAGLKSPIEISAQILKTLRHIAEDTFTDDILLVGAVITVPAYFDDTQRQATKDAAKLAGINVLRLLNEPTAAAIAYGLNNRSAEGIFAIYDLGGGTFDISILKLTKNVFEVLSTSGDSSLGGDDFDYKVFDWICEESNLTLLSNEDICYLMKIARKAKEILSFKKNTHINAVLSTGQKINLLLSIENFVKLTQNLVIKTLAPCRKALRDSGLSINEINSVVLVGGATRMLHIRSAVNNFFQKAALTNIDPEKAVVLGAAIQANILSGNYVVQDNLLLLDVIPLSLGIETIGGLVEKVIPRNTTIPCARAQEFTTFKDGQTAMSIHVVQGERELAINCRSLARFDLRGIPFKTAGTARIRVTYQVDADGILSVSAREITSNVEAFIKIKPSYGLTDNDISRMLQESFECADFDMRHRALYEERFEAERILYATESALITDITLLNEKEIKNIKLLINNLRQTMQGDDHLAIKAAIDMLVYNTEEFATRRINRNVYTALIGKKINDV